jgi:hypothetical protein
MRRKSPILLGLIAVLFVVQFFLAGSNRTFWAKNYASGKGLANDLSPDQVLLQLMGFREFIAGILWVRADGYFDQGNYDAVLPIIRVCTILDPKQIDIYSTGMWHIAYNFTDEQQRSDRRYVPSALALGKEGARNNPNTYELFFETGWVWYHKIDDDYHQAVKWFSLAQQRKDMQEARKNLLANAFFRNNQLEEGIDLYWKLLTEARKSVDPLNGGSSQNADTIENNLDTSLVRLTQRGNFASKRGESLSPYDVSPKFDVGFSAQVTVDAPRVLTIVGTWNVDTVGTRIRVVVRDENHPAIKIAEMDWDARNTVDLEPDKTLTYAQDQLFVRNRRFKKTLDLSKDPTMYPFSDQSKNFIVEFYYNPRSAPAHIQDRFGYNGEGFTDKNFLVTNARENFKPVFNGDEVVFEKVGGNQPVMYTSLTFTRDQILRRKEWSAKTPVARTKGFDPGKVTTIDNEVIDIPSLRAPVGPQRLEELPE